MLSIPGYREPTKIHESGKAVIYRARREHDQFSVILKIPQERHQSKEELARYQHEYNVTHGLQLDSVARTYGLENHNNAPILVLEDFGGESLKALMATGRLSLPQKLSIAIKITQCLADIHNARIIHRDINPTNIVYNPESGCLKLIDFGLSSLLSREQPALMSPEILQGTLAYISPEQTGRMNRAVDYRSDFYSLGVTLYELFTGNRPFTVDDPLELVHCHIARQPRAPHEVDASIPPVLSRIILKLMAKTAEERYQGASGIKADLEECLLQLETRGSIIDFSLAKHDMCERFQIGQKLYGREREIAQLLKTFERVSAGGCEIMLVTGYSGIGKTSLVREIYKPITAQRGYFISGKFDQLQRNIPYKAVIDAFRELLRQLLTESEENLQLWRNKLQTALGCNGQVMIDVLPELEIIIGTQAPIQILGPTETQNRFHLSFHNFIQVFCSAKHPLVIYLDDLQWIDSASLKLLSHILLDKTLGYLFIIGAYRDNEIDASHPLISHAQALEKQGGSVNRLNLTPLSGLHVHQLIADALLSDIQTVSPLAERVLEKTGGNPFFTEEFLKSLHTDHLLKFDRQSGTWQWDMEKICALCTTDNIADLMASKLKRLNKNTQKALKLAACIGNSFDIVTLALVYEDSIQNTVHALRQAVTEGLLITTGNSCSWTSDERADSSALKVSCKFAHDRIQQAAYGLIDDDSRRLAHHKIGRLLHINTSPENLDAHIFEIVNHLNFGVSLISEEDEKLSLAKLNMKAADKAQKSAAYETAYNYGKTSLSLLTPKRWEKDYAFCLSVHTETAQLAYLNGAYVEMDALINTALSQAKTVLDKVSIYEIKIAAENARSNLRAACETTLTALALLGTRLPDKPSRFTLLRSLLTTKLLLLGKSIEYLAKLPPMTDPYRLAEMRLLQQLGVITYLSNSLLMPLCVLRRLELCIKYGNGPLSPYSYVSYGMLSIGMLNDINNGYRFGQLALTLQKTLNAPQQLPRTHTLANMMIHHWKEHIQTSLQPLQEAYEAGQEIGDFQYAGMAALAFCYHQFYAGKDLSTLADNIAMYKKILRYRLRQQSFHDVLAIYGQLINNLVHPCLDVTLFIGESFNEKTGLKRLEEKNNHTALYLLSFYKGMLGFLFENYRDAFSHLQIAKKYAKSVLATAGNPLMNFYESLTYLAICQYTDGIESKQLLKKVAHNQKYLKNWGRHAPMNHLHKYYLVEAEYQRILGNNNKAGDLYDRAISAARSNGYVQEEALANELTAKFYLSQNSYKISSLYMLEARQGYMRWGALSKVSHLDTNYRELLNTGTRSHKISDSIATNTGSVTSSAMDLKTLMLALKDITEEKVHSKIIEKTIHRAIEFAGAQNGFLLLRNPENELLVEAEISINPEKLEILLSIPVSDCAGVSSSIVNYVKRTKQSVVIHNAQEPQDIIPSLHMEKDICERKTKSILCIPFIAGAGEEAELIGLIYLENNSASYAFTEKRIETLEIICLSAAGRLELSRKAVTDGLTGLYNHDYFQGVLFKEASLSNRNERELSLLMIDIDYFKKFNDQWGHQIGDKVLQHVANLIKQGCRQSDVVARYGGEEMAVILPEAGAETVLEVAERIREYIESTAVIHGEHALKVTVSIGVSSLQKGSDDTKSLIKHADEALYRSKENGRNRVTVG